MNLEAVPLLESTARKTPVLAAKRMRTLEFDHLMRRAKALRRRARALNADLREIV